MRRRERCNPVPVGPVPVGVQNSYYRNYLYSANPFSTTYNGLYFGQDACTDETHPGPPYRSGGPLVVVSWSNPSGVFDQGRYTYGSVDAFWGEYIGGFIPALGRQSAEVGLTDAQCVSEIDEPGSVAPQNVNAGDYGATGWNKYRPGKPTADLGVFLGEIRDVPKTLSGTAKFFQNAWKMMGGSRGKPTKALANQWLSTQFGWLPFISDLRKFHRTYVDLDRRIQAIKDHNGRWLKRGGSIVDDASLVEGSSSETSSAHWPPLDASFYQFPAGSYRVTLRNSVRVWFEGSFRYWIPDIEAPIWRARAVAELYGAMPNPALIWELTPFSWLTDWISNAGDVVANMDEGWADNLAAKGAFVMKTAESVGEVSSFSNLKTARLHQTWVYPVVWKTRVGASPFGFGLTGADFTARQWSILAALGVQSYK